MLVKVIIVIAFLLILASLGSALFHLVKHEEKSEKTVRALTFRIGLSLILFIFLFIAIVSGLIKPHGISVTMQQQMHKAKIKQ